MVPIFRLQQQHASFFLASVATTIMADESSEAQEIERILQLNGRRIYIQQEMQAKMMENINKNL